MPRKLNQTQVFNEFQRYGFTISPNQTYQNTRSRLRVTDEVTGQIQHLTLQQLRYKVSRGRPEYDFNPYEIAVDDNFTRTNLSSFERFINKQSQVFRNDLSEEEQKQAFRFYQDIIKDLKKGKNFKLQFQSGEYLPKLYALNSALKVVGPKLSDDIRLTLTDESGTPNYAHLNSKIIRVIEDLINNDEDMKTSFSEDDFIESLLFIDSINFDFNYSMPKSRRRRVGFFPYFNKSDIDLSKFAIFNNYNLNNYSDNCLVYALTQSNLFDNDTLNLIRSFVKTRLIEFSDFEDICAILETGLIVKKYYPDTDKFSTSVYGEQFDRKLKLLVFHDHIMINEKVNVSEFYINNYQKVNSSRLANHERKQLVSKLNDKRHEFKKTGTSLSSVIKLLFKNNLFESMSPELMKGIDWSWTTYNGKVKNCTKTFKKIYIADKKLTAFSKDSEFKGARFFGYKPEPQEIEYRLNQLQDFVNDIPLRHPINIRSYFRFSELMQKIMFEYGCFDNVYKMTGDIASSIRNQCIFQKPHLPHYQKHFYSNEKLYYVDLNSAFLSVVTGIPSGLPDKMGHFEGENTKIVDLIKIFQNARSKADDKFKITLKSLITSCWGYSIAKPRNYLTRRVKDVMASINEYGERVASYKLNETPKGGQGAELHDNISGTIKLEQSFVTSYTYPQFARSVLTNYADKVNQICSIVNPLYFNIDAFLITESDYNKLLALDMVGNEMGKLKIEKVFTEFCCVSSRKYVATLENGEQYFHCVKKETYEEIKTLSQI